MVGDRRAATGSRPRNPATGRRVSYPPTYKLFSWSGVERNAWQDPDVLAPIEGKGVPVSAEKNGHVSVEVQVLPSMAPDSPTQ